MKNDFLSKFSKEIKDANFFNESDRKIVLENLERLQKKQLNILITGATGAGKSSTINALFEKPVAKVGEGVDPETMEVECYELGNIILWDSPGLGDSKENDARHSRNIINKLKATRDGNPLIDLVLVILDGGSRDMGTSYQLINEVIIPNLPNGDIKRLIVAINQADQGMKGREWDVVSSRPLPKLKAFLDEKICSVKKRIKDATGVDVDPIYYSAGYSENGCQQPPYNLSKLMYLIVCATPKDKKVHFVNQTNTNPEMWSHDDGLKEYKKEAEAAVKSSFTEALACGVAGAATGAKLGALVGSVFGPGGAAVGASVGKVLGAVGGFLSSWLK